MTGEPPPLLTHSAVASATHSPVVATLFDAGPHVALKAEPVEEEPYTIKCICNFAEDDGNTIYCEKCDTWQHIVCYYPDNKEVYDENFSHFCADCRPRPVDRQRAIEQQRNRLAATLDPSAANGIHDRKAPKRAPARSHKKKPKPSDIQLSTNVPPSPETLKHPSPHEGPHPAKKVKTSHRASHSVSSQTNKHAHAAVRASTHNGDTASPPMLSHEFAGGHDNAVYGAAAAAISAAVARSEQKVKLVQTNSFASLDIPPRMNQWLMEPDTMKQQTGREYKDVFQPLPTRMGDRNKPMEVRRTSDVPCLVTPVAVEREVPLIELNGLVGLQRDYCADPSSRYQDLSSPLPFVFFHPQLPVYIDTRTEGSEARYARRSCHPNAVLDTYLDGNCQYHFWLVSDRVIAAGEQVTIPWDFRLGKDIQKRWLHLLGIDDDDAHRQDEADVTDAEYQAIYDWLVAVLAVYGGCACNLNAECAFYRFRQSYLTRMDERLHAKKKGRKQKPHTASPTGTPHGTTSRAASEGVQLGANDQDALLPNGSRSKPGSRDLTPQPRQGSFDTLGILTQPTDRDKRKAAMVEDTFRRLEQQAPKRRKKAAESSNPPGTGAKQKASRPSISNTSTSVNGTVSADDATRNSKSASPSSATSPVANFSPSMATGQGHDAGYFDCPGRPAAARPSYVDVGIQTTPDCPEWYLSSDARTRPKRRVVSLSRRLMASRLRSDAEAEGRRRLSATSSAENGAHSPAHDDASRDPDESIHPGHGTLGPEDRMADAPVMESATPALPDAPTQLVEKPDSPTASTHIASLKIRSPELRVQLPPVPTFSAASSASIVETPSTATPTMAQSPFPSAGLPSPYAISPANGGPSPAKKKLSLSEYNRRINKTNAPAKVGATGILAITPGHHAISANGDQAKSPALNDEAGYRFPSPVYEKTGETAAVNGALPSPPHKTPQEQDEGRVQ